MKFRLRVFIFDIGSGLTLSGRVCRSGQTKKTEFRVLWVEGEPHDEAPRLSNKTRMSEAEALTQLDSQRLQKKKNSNQTSDAAEQLVGGSGAQEIASVFS